MNLIQPTITPGESGPHVSNLQDALLFLLEHEVYRVLTPPDRPSAEDLASLKQTLRAEQLTGQFGGATMQLVSLFQRQQGLGDHLNGIVEDTTAKKLDELLKQLRALDGERTFAVKGHVLRTGIDQPDVLVRVSAVDAIGETVLGESQTNSSGIYRVEFLASLVQASPGGAATDKGIVARAYRPDGSEMGAAQWAGAVEALMVLDVVVEINEFLVTGRITDSQGRPQPGLKVVAYDQDLRYRQRLGDASTDADGRYTIRYRREQFEQGEGQQPFAPDLVVEVLLEDNLEPLATSDRRHHAKPVEVIDLTVPTREPGPSEFERITAAVLPLLAGQGKEVDDNAGPTRREDLRPAELRFDDVTFICKETGLPVDAVEDWAEGARLHGEALTLLSTDASHDDLETIKKHGWPFLFAWRRAGLASGLDGVLTSSRDRWEAVLEIGVTRNLIVPLGPTESKLLLAALDRLGAAIRLNTRYTADPLVSAISSVPTGLPVSLTTRALDIYRSDGLSGLSKFDELAAADPAAADGLAKLGQALHAYDLADGEAALMQPLLKRLDGTIGGIEPLAGMASAQWMELVGGVLGDNEESVGKAALLQLKVEQIHPFASLQARLEEGVLIFDGHEPTRLSSLFSTNAKSVNSLLKGNDVPEDAFVAEHPELAGKLQGLGRWLKSGVRLFDGANLQKNGWTSPGILTRQGPKVIDSILTPLNPKIRKVLDTTLGRFRNDLRKWLHKQPGLNRPPIRIRPDGKKIPDEEPREPTAPGITSPTIRGMFGDLDECLCQSCNSVLGQSAYLVDLLNLLAKEVIPLGAGQQSGLDVLRARRPDILELELSCENTQTLFPHIDLALEVLEWRVGGGNLGYGFGTARPIAQWFSPQIDANLATLVQSTSAAPIGPLSASVDQNDARLWRVKDDLRTWTLRAIPMAGNPQQTRTFHLTGLAVRRTSSTPDPRIEPAHRLPQAYARLAQSSAVYPWTLPFDRDAAEARAFLAALQASRERLLALWHGTRPFQRADEALCLSDAERELIEHQPANADALWRVWGFADRNPVDVTDPDSGETLRQQTPESLLQRASFLLVRSGLSLPTLESVLATRFVGGLALTRRAECKPSLMRVTPTIQTDALDRVHRFVRLCRKLDGWTISDLDSAIEVLNGARQAGPRVLNREVVNGLATVREAAQVLGMPIPEVLGLIGPLDQVFVDSGNGVGWQSLFAQVFLTNLAGPAARAIFGQVATNGTEVTERASDQAEAIAAVLGAKAPDVAALIPTGNADKISHALMTQLYRSVTLSKALGLSPLELELLSALTGLNPISVAAGPLSTTQQIHTAFAELIAFRQATHRLHGAGIAISDAAIVLLPSNHTLRARLERSARFKKDDEIDGELKILRRALKAAVQTPDTDDTAVEEQVRQALLRTMGPESAQRVLSTFTTPMPDFDPAVTELTLLLVADAPPDEEPFDQRLIPAPEARELLTMPLSQRSTRSRLERVLAASGARAQRRILVEHVARWTGLSPESLVSLLVTGLTVDVTGGGVPQTAVEALTDPAYWSVSETTAVDTTVFTWARRLDHLVTLCGSANLPLILELFRAADWRTVVMPASLPPGMSAWQAFAPVVDLLWLALPQRLSRDALRVHVEASRGNPTDLVSAATAFAERVKVDPAELLRFVELVTGAPPTATTLRDPVVLQRLYELLEAVRPLRATASQVRVLAGPDVAAVARTARQLLAARVGEQAWPDTLRRIKNTLRVQQRDAMVAYLEATNPTLAKRGLYDEVLLDPAIEPCFMTSRVTQAVASVQLLVQRILLGLEPDALPNEPLRQHWMWMRSYRLWEANRKVFLYPENWLFPELRDDKSPSFRRLEADISQAELTHTRAEQAFGRFMEDVNHLAQTEVIGLYEDIDSPATTAGIQPTRRDLYLVGRSPNPPYTYHWRHCSGFGYRWMEWTPWERIELEIQSDHLVTCVLNGRLHLAWPVIQRIGGESASAEKWKVELAWSKLDGPTWRQVSTSRDQSLEIDRIVFEDERSGLAFRTYVQPGSSTMAVHVYAKQPLQGSVAEIPKPIPRIANTPRVPRRLLTESGIQELANLVKVSELQGRAPYLFDVLQLYCVAMFGVLRPGYTGLPLPMIFFNSDTLEWHRTVRKILDTQRHIESVQITPSRIKDFLEDFRSESGYSQTLQGTVTLVSFSYEQVVNGIIGGCSGRAVRYRAWVKLSEKPDGFLPLAPSDGEFEINIAGTTQKLKPGELSELTVRHGDTPGGQGNSARLTWTPLNKPPLTAELNLEAVQKGNATEETLHFEFSDLNNTSGLRARITATRAFRQVQRFVQPTSGAMVTERGDASELKLLDGFVDVWMNGFKEKSDSWSGYGLDLQTIRTVPQRVFGRSTSGVSYWVAGAANPGATHLNQTNIWFFSEGAARCLIDTAPVPRTSSAAAGIELFPAAWLSGDSLAKVWYESGRLPSGPDQRDDFGSAQLPPLDSSMRGALPSAVQQGRWLFDRRLPNACYHWEVFFHAPMLIADHLSKQQRFEDAERWLRLVFDPQSVDPATPTAFLRFRVFAEMPHGRSVANDLKTLAKAVADGTTSDPVAESIRTLISRWRNQPFRPFVIARGRPVAFLWRTVFAYLDNLIAWADDLFRRSTRESIAEAALLYVLADRILGPRPRRSAAERRSTTYSYSDLEAKWDDFANAWFDATSPAQRTTMAASASNQVLADDHTPAPEGFLFFCIPANEKLQTYWDTVSERLFNIRHCRDIDGVERELPLTEPPIDPELLVRATAAGLDIGAIVRDAYVRPLPYRYGTLVARALELTNEVKAMGSALLSALEKRDAETLALMRSTNELEMLKRLTQVREMQIEETERNLEALRASRAATSARYEQLQRQLGNASARPPREQEVVGEESPLGRPTSGNSVATSNWGLIVEELHQLEQQGYAAWWSDAESVSHVVAWGVNLLAAAAHITEAVTGSKKAEAWAKSLSALGTASRSTADACKAIAQIHQTEASRQGTAANHIRRRDEWTHQSNQSLRELRHIDKQILASTIRIELTKKELANHKAQVEQTEAIDTYLRTKFSNADLYHWMASQLTTLHRSAFVMALEMARRAERAAATELGIDSSSLIRNDYWSQTHAGLLSGERLHQDIKKLELHYLEQNKREHELTKHISLRRLNPEALLKLIFTGVTGECNVDIPEWLFDMDTPGHYLRRIRTVSLSIPCVVGPQASIHCKLTLLGSETRKDKLPGAGDYHRRNGTDDPRFTVRYGATESIVTSTGRDDSGLFETSLRDERYLPFEGAGAISRWKLELLDKEVPQFDHKTISDVIIHMRYTARDGGEGLQTAATKSITATGATLGRPIHVLFSARHDFPVEWAKAASSRNPMDILINHTLLPYSLQARKLSINSVATWDAQANTFQVRGLPGPIGPGHSSSVSVGPVHALKDGDDLFIQLKVE